MGTLQHPFGFSPCWRQRATTAWAAHSPPKKTSTVQDIF